MRTVACVLVLAALAAPALPLVGSSSAASSPCLLSSAWDCPLVTPGGYVTEPTVHEAPNGDIVVCGPNGVPSDSSLWRLDATRHFQPLDRVPTAPFGGGDCDFQFDASDDLYMIDLWLGDTSIARSADHQSWDYSSPVTFKQPVGDRQWIDAAGNGVVYITWRNLADGIWAAKSTDGGVTFLPETPVAPAATRGGNLVIDKQGDPTLNTVYTAWAIDRVYQSGAPTSVPVIDNVYLAKTTDGGLTWSSELVHAGRSLVSQNFPVVALDAQSRPYVSWAENDPATGAPAIYVSHRNDDGSWSAPDQVSAPGTTNTFPWLTVGDAGRIAVGWYGADYVGIPDDPGHDWYLHVAETTNGLAATPTWNDMTVEKIKTNDFICTQGTLCVLGGLNSPGRELGDFLTVDKDHRGAVIVSYNGNVSGDGYTTRFIRQACGPSLYASVGRLSKERDSCAGLAAPPPLTATPLTGTWYATGLTPVNTVDGVATSATTVTSFTQQAPTSTVPKVATNQAGLSGSNAGTIYDAHWFLDAPANGLALNGTVTAHLFVTTTGANEVATVSLYDAGSGTFAPVASPIATQQVALAPGGPQEIVVPFGTITRTLTSGFELYVNVGGGQGDAQVLYDSTLAPTRVEIG
jgi:hypothetical protein